MFRKYLIIFSVFLFIPFNLQSAPDLATNLASCIKGKSLQIDQSDQEMSLLAVSSCMSSYLQQLEQNSVVINEIKPVIYFPTFPGSGLTGFGSEDDGAGDNVYYGTGIFGAGNATDHQYNAALGYQALYSLTNGDNNTALGYKTLYDNTTGLNNTAVGSSALENNTTGSYNFSAGYQALYTNNIANYNVAIGNYSMDAALNAAVNNTAVGYGSLGALTQAIDSVVVGHLAGAAVTTGGNQIFLPCLPTPLEKHSRPIAHGNFQPHRPGRRGRG